MACAYRPDNTTSEDTVNYCYNEVSCYGSKIPTLTGELLMTKAHCCKNVTGVSWGGNDDQCESCAEQTADSTDLPAHASGKYIARVLLLMI